MKKELDLEALSVNAGHILETVRPAAQKIAALKDDLKAPGSVEQLLGYMLGLKIFANITDHADAELAELRELVGITPENWELLVIQVSKEFRVKGKK